MNAVILAGGEKPRLCPVSQGMSGAMTPLLDRPVLEHLLLLLKRHAAAQVCVVLEEGQKEPPCAADGEALGMRLVWVRAERGLGTADSVKHCQTRLGEEDVLVIPGGIVCDLDLTAAMDFHRAKGGQATLVLCRHPRPQEHTLVITDPEGRVVQRLDRPAWGQAAAGLVDTGIVLLSPGALKGVRPGEGTDLGRDVLPALPDLYACAAEGYWNDLGDCAAYLDCAADALSGKVRLEPGLELRSPGVWSAQPVPEGVALVPPCWIGPEVELGSGSLIGPHVVLGRGSRVGRRSMVQRSVLNSAQVGDRATLYGAILCPGARAGNDTVLNEGTVLGENALAEDRAVLMERVKVWPGRRVETGCWLTRSVTATGGQEMLRFGDGGVLRGELGESIGPEVLLTLGGALGPEGKVGLGFFGGPGARMLAQAAASGIAAAGGTALRHDMECAAQAAWLGEQCQLPASLFVEQEGDRVYLHLFDRQGLPLGRERQRRLEHALEQGASPEVRAGRVGSCEQLHLGPGDYARDAARRGALYRTPIRRPQVAVTGTGPADRAIRAALEELGCPVTDRWQRGIPAFSGSFGGFRLAARDESGAMLSPGQLLVMAALVELENGGGRLAVPAEASAAVELVAAGFRAPVLRLGRDGAEAERLYCALPWLRDAAFGAVRLCARLAAAGERLEELSAKTPRFAAWTREVPLSADRGAVMGALADRAGQSADGTGGLRLRTGKGWVYLRPLSRRSALKVVAEGPDLELAAELCDLYARKAARADAEVDRERRTK